MSKLRFIVFISGAGSNLKALFNACESGLIQANLVGVISDQFNAAGIQYAQSKGIATTLIPKNYYSNRHLFDQTLLSVATRYKPDLIVLAGYMRILSSEFIAQAPCPLLNIHPSLLPAYKGLHTHARVLQNQETHHGLTIHLVSAELDAGPPIIQVKLTIHPEDTADTLKARVQKLEHLWYPRALSYWSRGRLTFPNHQTAYWDQQPLPPSGKVFNESDPPSLCESHLPLPGDLSRTG